MDVFPVLCAVCLLAASSFKSGGGQKSLQADDSYATSGTEYYGGGGGGFFIIIIGCGCCYYRKRRRHGVVVEDRQQLEQHEQPPGVTEVHITTDGDTPGYPGMQAHHPYPMNYQGPTREYITSISGTYLGPPPGSDVVCPGDYPEPPGESLHPAYCSATSGEYAKTTPGMDSASPGDSNMAYSGSCVVPSGECGVTHPGAFLVHQEGVACAEAIMEKPDDPPPPYDAKY